MNIFALDRDPIIAASMHCDSHVVKMILESTQVLSTALRINFGEHYVGTSKSGRKVKRWKLAEHDDTIYSATHVNHPSCVWARSSYGNFKWLASMTFELVRLYEESTGKMHACRPVLELVCAYAETFEWKHHELAPVLVAMDDQYKIGDGKDWDSVVASYRSYYNKSKSRFATFGKYGNEQPNWFRNEYVNL